MTCSGESDLPSDPTPPLRFAIYVESDHIPEWRKRAVRLLCETGTGTLALVIQGARQGARTARRIEVQSLPLRLYLAAWVDRSSRLAQRVELRTIIDDAQHLSSGDRVCNHDHRSPSSDLDQIRRHDLDFILDCRDCEELAVEWGALWRMAIHTRWRDARRPSLPEEFLPL